MSLYATKKWERKRNVVLRRDKYECRECKRYGKTTLATVVHHIYPLEYYPQYALLTDNLLSVCGKCHNSFHDRLTDALTEKGLYWKTRTILSPHL